jgi:hypothetical protein
MAMVGRGCPGRAEGRRIIADIVSHPSVEGIKRAVQAKGGTAGCNVCGREEFTLEEVTVFGAGMAEQYGTRRRQRAQLVCENCGHVMNFDLTKLRPAGGAS